jgi:hypothetical protein
MLPDSPYQDDESCTERRRARLGIETLLEVPNLRGFIFVSRRNVIVSKSFTTPSIISPLMQWSLYTARTPIRLKTIPLQKMIRSYLIALTHKKVIVWLMIVIFVMTL